MTVPSGGDDDFPKDPPGEKSASPDLVRVTARACPICGHPVEARYRPFCSKRCADIDLGRWVLGTYRIETNEAPDPDEM
ncbi:DNA gyrase inhibitor YacG [Rhodospirillum rubrum]|uniref:DNA gyrase inhibitor YacG n=1 Tax=Rhodospirillum rubrum (strain ATCC 11170 / ATH 1.1.1 / DSM 467 / LMG 4362 / NCIMB 8255 / S1) TaxID=269796 RepID=Q2RQN2_RHORT|nr:DNA gyrase inhibitor YacG [Rhodospirillum rubrum]ABC23563.1 Protein of unknown function DUF329 [Rhodospirillum rubrum ATCC 11170]AEO49301.1 hypothetical protein F11_14195 [Rhodospirillum rubrum F11]MBK5955238.1 DNA gyrase inhibitor YacG [Rhodospirillum rubrum]QXG79528.1 DNA gyrase inhibitor YacG [Rhodospirillum rubrum]